MIIKIVEGEDAGVAMQLEDFLQVNEFDGEYADEIRDTLETMGSFSDGGGAAPEWCIQTVEATGVSANG